MKKVKKTIEIIKQTCYNIACNLYGAVGEVVNTVDCGSIMQGFDSLTVPH